MPAPRMRTTPLPGIGVQYDLTTRERRHLSVIAHRDGTRTVNLYRADDPDACAQSLHLTGAEATSLIDALMPAHHSPNLLHTTDLGKAMRAAAQKPEVAMLMGINPNRVFCVALGIALALAGAAGSLLMPFYPAYPMVGQVFVLMAFVAVVLGTLGNVVGALIASLMMGVAESLGIQFVGADSGLIVVFMMLLLTLAVRPSGLAGGRVR